jgi:hypothetical protein
MDWTGQITLIWLGKLVFTRSGFDAAAKAKTAFIRAGFGHSKAPVGQISGVGRVDVIARLSACACVRSILQASPSPHPGFRVIHRQITLSIAARDHPLHLRSANHRHASEHHGGASVHLIRSCNRQRKVRATRITAADGMMKELVR